ncbi:hypothetical protein ACM01_44280 [Streptomyces viridochromogenes]|uniref:Uncharacterized protein n=2 Tax=Streptomyces TaxID=1883 RepID=A0A0J7YV84_STRVR|nr:hypothetical protein [Streptomyces viridochromogenes]KMS67033.1 hypothetical protein ACM01_44280 [Streptomyces viridochromogenes]KOG26162.1 hypothetical protein ADK36_03695 [Streptomyces viridochromogenes]KOG27696.1 hypothetical protein ADK35_05040 [Streptomyces viridochromogenes]
MTAVTLPTAGDSTWDVPGRRRSRRPDGMALVEVARMDPRAWPDVRDPGSVEEIREAFGRRCWIQYMPHAGAIEVRDIGWAG